MDFPYKKCTSANSVLPVVPPALKLRRGLLMIFTSRLKPVGVLEVYVCVLWGEWEEVTNK